MSQYYYHSGKRSNRSLDTRSVTSSSYRKNHHLSVSTVDKQLLTIQFENLSALDSIILNYAM